MAGIGRKEQLRVFLSVTSLEPEHGGPAVSVSRLGLALADLGVQVALWASDGSAPSSRLVGTHPNLQALAGDAASALGAFGHADVVHDNGIWLAHHHALARLAGRKAIPRIVSLRGMLEPWAFRHRRLKKRVAWSTYQRRDLATAQSLHATAKSEADYARTYGLDVDVQVVPNGVDKPDRSADRKSFATHKDAKTALFLSRLHPKKGLPMLLEAWAHVRPAEWRLQVAGPDEGAHRAKLERLTQRFGLSEVVSFLGPVYGAAKVDLYRDADLFVLPSYSENFGNVVAEALAYGVPVLTTQGTPWGILEEHKCGWWVPPNLDGVVKGLRAATTTPSECRFAMGGRGAALVAEQFDWGAIGRRFRTVYRELISRC